MPYSGVLDDGPTRGILPLRPEVADLGADTSKLQLLALVHASADLERKEREGGRREI